MTREEALNKAINIVSYVEAHLAKSKEAREEAVNIIKVLEQELCVAPQPDTARRIVEKSRGGMTLWYQCEICNEPVDVQDTFCSGCGRRLEDGCEKQAEEGR